jgi:hypothetical protein
MKTFTIHDVVKGSNIYLHLPDLDQKTLFIPTFSTQKF